MVASDDALETYTHLPLHIDPQSKQISVSSSDKSLQEAIANLNALHQSLKSLETANHVPPPPIPVNPKRSAQIQKLRDTAAQAARKGQHADAIRPLSVAIDMATARPVWEPAGLLREELAFCYLARAASNAALQNWIEAWKDAECSAECKSGFTANPDGTRTAGNPQAFGIGAQSLFEMGRWSDAIRWLEKGLDLEGNEGEPAKELAKMLAHARQKEAAQLAKAA